MQCVEGLKKYYSELEKDFHHLLVEVLEQYRATTVNDLRDNLERQSAFFRLLAVLDPGFSPTLATTAFGKIYLKAGKVLDREKAFGLVTALERGEELGTNQAARLKKQVTKAREKFRTYTSRHSLLPIKRLASLIRSRLKFLPEKDLRDRFQDYFRQLFLALKSALEADKDLDLISERARELYFNLLLIRRLCSSPQTLSDQSVAQLEKVQELLTSCHELTQTIALGAAARKEWPAPLVQRLDAERKTRITRARVFFEGLDDELPALEERLLALLASEPLEGGRFPKKGDPSNQKNVHSSFGQINVDEGIK